MLAKAAKATQNSRRSMIGIVKFRNRGITCMERRDFFCSAAAVAAGTLAAAPVLKADDQAAQRKYGVKITVVKRDFY